MDNLECEICCHLYDEKESRPRNLPCGHTFCGKCMTKEITNGKKTCPTCRMPHKANNITDLPMSVTLERLIRDVPKTSKLSTKARDSVTCDDEDDYSGGVCSVHKKSFVYFFCSTHSLEICRECTVLDHPTTKCNIISFKEVIEKKKEESISQATSKITVINETLASLDNIVKENHMIIFKQVQTNQKRQQVIESARKTIKDAKQGLEDARKAVEAATMAIAHETNTIEIETNAIDEATRTVTKRKNAIEKATSEMFRGVVNRNNIQASQSNLKNANTMKTITKRGEDLESLSKNTEIWMQDVSRQFDEISSAPAQILKGISNGLDYCAETMVGGTQMTAKFKKENGKLHMHPFINQTSKEEAITLQYEKVLASFSKPSMLLFIDLTHNDAYKGRIYIRIKPELHNYFKDIRALVTAENGSSILGNVSDQGSRPKPFYFGINVQTSMKDISSLNSQFIPKYAEVHFSHQDDLICRMFICIEYGIQRNFDGVQIGKIEYGLDVAKECKMLWNKEEKSIIISDCGLVLEI